MQCEAVCSLSVFIRVSGAEQLCFAKNAMIDSSTKKLNPLEFQYFRYSKKTKDGVKYHLVTFKLVAKPTP